MYVFGRDHIHLGEDKPIMNTIALLDNLDKHLGSDRFFGVIPGTKRLSARGGKQGWVSMTGRSKEHQHLCYEGSGVLACKVKRPTKTTSV